VSEGTDGSPGPERAVSMQNVRAGGGTFYRIGEHPPGCAAGERWGCRWRAGRHIAGVPGLTDLPQTVPVAKTGRPRIHRSPAARKAAARAADRAYRERQRASGYGGGR
jgi:hypothetical protein